MYDRKKAKANWRKHQKKNPKTLIPPPNPLKLKQQKYLLKTDRKIQLIDAENNKK